MTRILIFLPCTGEHRQEGGGLVNTHFCFLLLPLLLRSSRLFRFGLWCQPHLGPFLLPSPARDRKTAFPRFSHRCWFSRTVSDQIPLSFVVLVSRFPFFPRVLSWSFSVMFTSSFFSCFSFMSRIMIASESMRTASLPLAS